MMSYLLFVLLGIICVDAQAVNGPIVSIAQGNVVGVNDGELIAFYGIPYAGNPSGSNRFKAPAPAPSFPGDFHAIQSSKTCAQPSPSGLVGDENCLVLNIFTKDLTAPKPVLVWIYGEEYTSTVSKKLSYKGLVDQNVLVVSINYRTSIFGFLCLGVEEAPGNAGLKDIVAGLDWIKRNIAPFGGDPNNIVLFGHGSGAALVDLLTLSPVSTNFISKAIVSSGSALAPWAVAYDPVGYAKALGAKLGYTDMDTKSLAQHLQTTDMSVLIPALEEFRDEIHNSTALFAPCIENAALNGSFLLDAPIDILRSGNYSHIPYVTGYVNREGTIKLDQVYSKNWLDKMQANFSDFLQADLLFSDPKEKEAYATKIKQFYFQKTKIDLENLDDYIEYFGDTMFIVAIIKGARERALTSQAPVRLYQFSYRGTQNSDWVHRVPLSGAKHGSLLNYIFDYDLKNEDVVVKTSLQKRWTSFAQTSVPVSSTAPGNIDWPAINGTHLLYLSYNGESLAQNIQTLEGEVTKFNPHKQEMDFWDNIYLRHYKTPPSVSGANVLTSMALFVVLSLFSQFVV